MHAGGPNGLPRDLSQLALADQRSVFSWEKQDVLPAPRTFPAPGLFSTEGSMPLTRLRGVGGSPSSANRIISAFIAAQLKNIPAAYAVAVRFERIKFVPC